MRFHWAEVQSRIYSAFEVSDGEENEESHNCTDAADVFSKTVEDEKVGETEGVDHREDLQSNSARDVSSKAKKHKKTGGERCGDKVKDANGSEGEAQGEQEDLSGDDVLPSCSNEDDDEKLRHTEQIDHRDELQTNLENRELKKKYQGEHEETEGKGCGDKNTDANGSEDKDHDEIPDEKGKKKKCPLSHCNSFVRHLPRHLRDVHKWFREYLEQPHLDSIYASNILLQVRKMLLLETGNCEKLTSIPKPIEVRNHAGGKESLLFKAVRQ